MYSTLEHLKKKTPAGGIDRQAYIELLIEEFHVTTDVEAQEQISANLANFAYDPINYSVLKKSGALELFLQILNTSNDKLILHGIAAICNLCSDEYFYTVIVKKENLQLITKLLHKKHTEIIINTLGTLLLILNSNLSEVKDLICTPESVQIISELRKSRNIQIKNLSVTFIEDYCTKTQLVQINSK